MEEISQISDKAGQTYVLVSGQFHKAYTTNEFVMQRQMLDHDISNLEYVRQCCNKRRDTKGQVPKLPPGWACGKYHGRIYVYKLEKVGIKENLGRNLLLSWEKTEIDYNTEMCLRACKREAALTDKPIKVEVIFYPAGIERCVPIGGEVEYGRIISAAAPFMLTWSMELVEAYNKNVNAQQETEKRFHDIWGPSFENENVVIDFRKRCLWCAEYKKGNLRSDSRFCCHSHQNNFNKWKKKTILQYKNALTREKAGLAPSASDPFSSVPEPLGHLTAMDALNKRYDEIIPGLCITHD